MNRLDELFVGPKALTERVKSLESQTRGVSLSSGGYQQVVANGGSIYVSSGGYITLDGTGNITAGDIDGARTEMSFAGISGYNTSGVKQVFLSSETGALSILGSGGLSISGGGSAIISNGGNLFVTDTGKIVAGNASAQRTEISASGLRGYSATNTEQVRLDSSDGKLKILGQGSVVVSTGSIIAGNEGSNRLELQQGGIFVYDASNTETVSISTTDGKVRIDADAFIVDGTVNFDSLSISGALTVSQNLIVGSNVLNINTTGQRVGVNRVADPQFDLDVNGSFRAGGYIVGKHAIQLPDALFIAHYDGAGVVGTDLTGDATGHKGQKATITGNVSYPEGKFNKGIQLNSGAQVVYSRSGNILSGSGSINVWVKPTVVSAQVIFGHGSSSTDWIRIAHSSTQKAQAWIGNGAITSSVATLPTNSWSMLTVTWNGTSLLLYVNGVLDSSTTYTTSPSLLSTFNLGGDPGGYNPFTGVIDDLVITSSVLNPTLIRAIYESNAPVFAETSNWGFKTANTLAWADEEGLWAIDNSGNAAFGVSGVNSKSWGNLGSTLLDKGDVLLGNSSNYVLWDASAGKLSLVGQMNIGTTNKLWLNDANDGGLAIGGSNKASAPFRVSTSGALTASNATINGSITSGYNNLDSSGVWIETPVTGWDTSRLFSFKSAPTSGGARNILASFGAYNSGYPRVRIGVNDPTDNSNILPAYKGSFELNVYSEEAYSPSIGLYSRYGSNTKGIFIDTKTTVLGDLELSGGGRIISPSVSGNLSATGTVTGAILTSNAGIGTDGAVPSGGITVAVGGSTTSGLASLGSGNWELRSISNTRVAAVYGGSETGFQIDPSGSANAAGLNYALRFGTYGSGEGISSPRVAGAANLFGLNFWTSFVARMTISSSGEVAIGYGVSGGAGNTRLTLKGAGTGTGTYTFYAQNSGGTSLLYLRDDGACAARSNWTILSDIRDKKNVQDLPKTGFLDKISQLRGIKYNLEEGNDDTTLYGYSAQEFLPIFPELVDIDETRNRLSIRYGDLIPVLTQAISELTAKVKELEDRLA